MMKRWMLLVWTACAVRACGTVAANGDEAAFLHGFNYVRLDHPQGGKHTTFAPESFDPERAGRMLETLQANGFNCVRVFVSSDHNRPGSLFPGKDDAEMSGKYMDNFSQFLRLAQARNIGVIPSFEFLPLNKRYIGDGPRESSGLTYVNRMLLDPRYIRGRQEFLSDFVRAIKTRNPELLAAIVAYDIQNELCFHMTYPFDQQKGTFTAPNGNIYNLVNQKTLLADDAAIYWVDAMCSAIRREDPDAKVVTTIFPYHSVGRTGPGDFTAKAAAWQNRYPFRPLAMARSQAHYISIHLYPRDADEFLMMLGSVEFAELKKTAAQQGKRLLCTEFGIQTKSIPEEALAAKWAAELQQLVIGNGFGGCLYWHYDTLEQPALWSASSGQASIFKSLAGRNGMRRSEPGMKHGGSDHATRQHPAGDAPKAVPEE